MIDGNVNKWELFKEGRTNVHDDYRSEWLTVITADFIKMLTTIFLKTADSY